MKPTQLPSGAWRAKVFVGRDELGKKKFVSITRNSKNECLRDAAAIAAHHHEITRDSSAMTLEEAIDDYLESRSNILSPSTIRAYKTIRKHYLQPEMSMRLSSITDRIAQRAINREAKDKAPKTVSNIFGLMSVVVKHYTDRSLRVALPPKQKRRPNILTEDELRILIRAVDGHRGELPILLALFLGLRRGEIIGLTAEDYDPKAKTLFIHRVLVENDQSKFVEKNTAKTPASTRLLTVPDYLAQRIEKALDDGGKINTYSPSRLSKVLDDICKDHGLPKMTLHDLRRQNASVMLSLGIADKYAMERGGWSSPSIMKNVYQMTMSDKRKMTDSVVNRYFESLAGPVDQTQD